MTNQENIKIVNFDIAKEKVIMNTVEKRDYIHSHLHKVSDPAINDIYLKMLSLVRESMLEESEQDIKEGKLISHDALKKEVKSWRITK